MPGMVIGSSLSFVGEAEVGASEPPPAVEIPIVVMAPFKPT